MAVLTSDVNLAFVPEDHDAEKAYPYRYPALEPILNTAPLVRFRSAATDLGAALALLAAGPTDSANAAPAAFAVLSRAARTGGCDTHLNLLLVVAADINTAPESLETERRRANEACGHDPTADWLVGQRQLRTADRSTYTASYEVDSAQTPDGIATMLRLAADHPQSMLALTGLGDAYLTAAMAVEDTQPFRGRVFYRHAHDTYSDALTQGGGRAAAIGAARALIGLGQPAQAVPILEEAARGSMHPGLILEILIVAYEAAGEFGDAADTGRRLAALGSTAYPPVTALIPVPGSFSTEAGADTSRPLSLGADRHTPLRRFLVEIPIGGGAEVTDLSFIPRFRDYYGLTGTPVSCASWIWRRDEVVAGQPERALENWPESFESVRPEATGCPDGDALRAVAELEAGRPQSRPYPRGDEASDARQNLLRWGGDLRGARQVVEDWESARGDSSALPALRSGEVAFLQGRYDSAAAAFGLAARRTRLLDWEDDLGVGQAELARGAALIAAGRGAEAEPLLRQLDELGTRGAAYHADLMTAFEYDFAALSYYAALQLGDVERRTGRIHAAAEDYEKALSWLPTFAEWDAYVDRPEALYNNAALAHLDVGNSARATELAREALTADPMNPAFLMTAGFIAERRSSPSEAVRWNRQALRSDPGAFPAANDLGVQLARGGRRAEALEAFRQAVGARPEYALGWFNLGVLASGMGPGRFLEAQDALGRAFALDSTLEDRRRELTIDGSVYRTSLDLSKPLPPAWSLAGIERTAAATSVGLLATLALGLALARTAGRQGPEVAEQWLGPASRQVESLTVSRRLRHPAWAIAATVLTFLLAGLRRQPALIELAVHLIGVLVLVCTAVLARSAVAGRRGKRATQRTWLPSLVFGLATGAAGFPWAPLPVVDVEDEDIRTHLAAPVVLGLLAVALFAEAAWLHTPATHAWGLAALIMSASLMLPVGPLDGAHTGKAGVAAGAGIVATGVLIGVGIL